MTFGRKAIALFSLALLATGCDTEQRIEKITGPAYSNTYAQTRLVQGIEQAGSEQACTQQISPGQEATLSVPGYAHSLYIPKKAAGSPAYYCMRVSAGTAIKVELFAFRNSTLDSQFHTFENPLLLTLSYAGASLVDWTTLRIGNVYGDAVLETVPTAIDPTNTTVSGWLSHFSDWAIISVE